LGLLAVSRRALPSDAKPVCKETWNKVLTLTRQLVEEMHPTTLMVTHHMKHAIELGDRLIMKHQGGITSGRGG
jgi:ABC-type uncharacterized transport system ATPase component